MYITKETMDKMHRLGEKEGSKNHRHDASVDNSNNINNNKNDIEIVNESNKDGDDDDDDDDDEDNNNNSNSLDGSSNNNSKYKPPLKMIQIVIATIGYAVIEFEWAMLYVYGNPVLRLLGTNQILVGLAWSLSPILIIFVQPFIGLYSDRCTSRWGRRRPFLLATSIICVCAVIALPRAEWLASLIVPTEMVANLAIFIGMMSVMLLDLTSEVIYYLLRALLVDVLPSDQSEVGNSMVSWMLGAGGLAGNLVGSINIGYYFGDDSEGGSIRWTFAIVLVVFVICFAATLLTINETPLKKPKKGKSFKNPVIEIFEFVKFIPKVMLRICFIDFFGWFALFTFFMYSTDWVGENIYHGTPHGADKVANSRFEEGVRYGAYALAMTNVISLVVSPIIPTLINLFGIKQIYLLSHVFLSILMLMSYHITSPTSAFLMMTLCGVPYCINESIPFIYISKISNDEAPGLFFAVLQNFAVAAKLTISIGIGYVITTFGGNIASGLGFGGISAIIASYLVYTLPDVDRPEYRAAHLPVSQFQNV